MKSKMIILVGLVLCTIPAFAQNQIGQLVEKVAEQKWINGKVIENFVSINATDAMWERMMQNDRDGLNKFAHIGSNIISYLDSENGSKIEYECATSSSTELEQNKTTCEDRLQKLKSRLHFNFNSSNIQLQGKSYELAIGCLYAVSTFLGKDGTKGVSKGWQPKNGKLIINISIQNTSGMPSVKWNNDFTQVDIAMPVASETGGWMDKLYDDLMKGGNIVK